MKEIAMRFRWLEFIDKLGFNASIKREAGSWLWHIMVWQPNVHIICELEGKKLTEVLAQAKAETLKYIKGDFLKKTTLVRMRETIWK